MTKDSSPTRILIVDDEPNISRLVSQLLTVKGYDSRVCDSGAQALAAIAAEEFALVISDINMPGMSGIELLASVKNPIRAPPSSC